MANEPQRGPDDTQKIINNIGSNFDLADNMIQRWESSGKNAYAYTLATGQDHDTAAAKVDTVKAGVKQYVNSMYGIGHLPARQIYHKGKVYDVVNDSRLRYDKLQSMRDGFMKTYQGKEFCEMGHAFMRAKRVVDYRFYQGYEFAKTGMQYATRFGAMPYTAFKMGTMLTANPFIGLASGAAAAGIATIQTSHRHSQNNILMQTMAA